MLMDFLEARPRLTATLGLALGALYVAGVYTLGELVVARWNPFA